MPALTPNWDLDCGLMGRAIKVRLSLAAPLLMVVILGVVVLVGSYT